MLYDNKATDALGRMRPTCDLCKAAKAAVDGKTQMGPWGYMCHGCHLYHGVGLGMGRGQVLLCEDDLDEKLLLAYALEES